MRGVQRIAAPSDYTWKAHMIVDRFHENPFDLFVVIVFIAHIVAYFCLLILLKVKHCRKKLFAVSQ
ncbi:hypothetical protein X943_003669 [Babesia divergens]|uniref:Uncharacterized protein n=1 Tax=Babesia divergens TaxID=32595 RepID=A0AAD9GAT1_BABDI|nr:hypothetical protein X943_003669 [Babesia divergens]